MIANDFEWLSLNEDHGFRSASQAADNDQSRGTGVEVRQLDPSWSSGRGVVWMVACNPHGVPRSAW